MATGDKHEKPCPNCGHCPTCGKSNWPKQWYPWQYPQPTYPQYPGYWGYTTSNPFYVKQTSNTTSAN